MQRVIDPQDDRTTRARIRDAAIASIAEVGVADTTARRVAELAGVSPGLVMHYFGSMDGLRVVCDEHVAAAIRRIKEDAFATGPGIDILQKLRESDTGPLLGYIANVLTEDSPTVAALVDDLVDDAEEYIEAGIESGMLRPSENSRGRAVVMTMWNLGSLVLHRHLQRLLGVDLTDPAFAKDPSFAAYGAPVYEIYGGGVLTEAFAANVRRAMAELAATTAENQENRIEESRGRDR